MEQLSFLPEVESKPIKTKQVTQQLSLLPPTAYAKPSKAVPKVKPIEPKCSYQGKTGRILKRFTDGFDGITLKICKVEFDDGTIQDVFENHLELL